MAGTCRGAHSCPRSATNGPGPAPRPLPCRKMHTFSSQAADSQCPTPAASLPQETEGRSHRRAAYVDGTARQRPGRAGALAQRPGRQVGSRCAKQMRSRAALERERAGSRRRRRPARVFLSCQRGGTGSTESGQPPGGRHGRHSEPETTTATLVVALLIQTTVPAPAASGRRRRSPRSGPPPPSPTARVAPSPAASPESPSRGSAR